MKTSSAELKLRAKRSLSGQYGTAIGAGLIVYGILIAIMFVMEMFMLVGAVILAGLNPAYAAVLMIVFFFLIYAIIIMFQYLMIPGVLRMYLHIGTGETAKVSDVFFAFKNRPLKFLGIGMIFFLIILVLMIPNLILAFSSAFSGRYAFFCIFTGFYSLLLWVLGIYVGLNYGQFYLILVENPEKGILQALKESKELMKGNKGRYFLLGLSFLGWLIFTTVTLGAGFLWLIPYMACTYIHFYLDLKPQVEEIPPQWKTEPEIFQEQTSWDDAEVWQENQPENPGQ